MGRSANTRHCYGAYAARASPFAQHPRRWLNVGATPQAITKEFRRGEVDESIAEPDPLHATRS